MRQSLASRKLSLQKTKLNPLKDRLGLRKKRTSEKQMLPENQKNRISNGALQRGMQINSRLCSKILGGLF